jgi:hypothetical protein
VVRRTGLAVVLVVTVAAGSAGAAPARDTLIRPGVGIGKVRLGMTITEARRALGRPLRFVRAKPFPAQSSRYIEYRTHDAVWTIAVFGIRGRERVARIRSGVRSERTRNGVGVGTPVRQLPVKLRSLRPMCRRGRPSAPGTGATSPPEQLVSCAVRTKAATTIFAGDATCASPFVRHQGCEKVRVAVVDVTVESDVLRRFGLSYWYS